MAYATARPGNKGDLFNADVTAQTLTRGHECRF